MREGALPYKRLSPRDLQVRQIGYEAGGGSQFLQLVRTDGLMAKLEFQIGDYAREVGIAAALPIAIQTALHVAHALPHRGQRVGHRYIGIVMSVNSDDAIEARANLRDDLS